MTRTASVDITPPEESEVRAAVQGRRELAAYLATNFETRRIQIVDDRNVAHQIELPTSALRALVDILAELALGNAVRVVPVHAELTTQEAADMLDVSRPHFIKLLETHALPCHRTGKHRRIRLDDLVKFKVRRDQASERAMSELAKQAQELKLGYLDCAANESSPVPDRLDCVARFALPLRAPAPESLLGMHLPHPRAGPGRHDRPTGEDPPPADSVRH